MKQEQIITWLINCLEITFPLFSHRHNQLHNNQQSSIINNSCGTESHMNIHQMDDAVQWYFAEDIARSTHKTYAAAECHYRKDFNLIPLPVSESTLCYCVVCLGQQGLAHSCISTYLSGITQVQISWIWWPSPGLNVTLAAGSKRSQSQSWKGRESSPFLIIYNTSNPPNIKGSIRSYTRNLCSIPQCYGLPQQ